MSWLNRGLTSVLRLTLRLIAQLPLPWQLALGRAAGTIAKCLLASRRHIAACNIKACLPDLSTQQRKKLEEQSFKQVAMGIMEANFTWHASAKRFLAATTMTIEGEEHLAQAVATGRGVIILSGHFVVMEAVARLFAQNYSYAVVYRRQQGFLEQMMTSSRSKYLAHQIDRTDIRSMVRWLKAGNVLWYAPDQDFGPERSVFADFMGVPAATVKASSQLAAITDAIVIPGFFARTNTSQPVHYLAQFEPPFQPFPSGDQVVDARRYNDALSRFTRRYPDQYFWLHRRFKTRPKGSDSIY